MGEKKKKKYRKRVRRIAAVSLLLFAAFSFWLVSVTPGFVKKQIDNYIQESSHGEYALSFNDIKVNIYTRTVKIDSLRLIPLKTDQTHYSLETQEVKASGISLADLLLHRRLNVGLLLFKKPDFVIFGADGQRRDAPDPDKLRAQLLPFFDQDFRGIHIDEIKLDQAEMSHYRLNELDSAINSVQNLNIGIVDFEIDSTILARGHQFFQADDIFVQMVNFQRAMGDSIHSLAVDQIVYSIEKQEISCNNLSLHPTSNRDPEKTRYWIKLPHIKLKAEDLRKIIGNDSVQIDSVTIGHANIHVQPNEQSEQLNLRELEQYNIYDLIKNDFRFIHVNQFSLQADSLSFASKQDPEKNSQLFTQIKIDTKNFQLDSTSHSHPEKVLYSDQFQLSIGAYELALNDQVHQFKANKIRISSLQKSMQAEDIQLNPTNPSVAIPVRVKLHTDSLRIDNVELAELFHHRQMPLKGLTVYRPQISLTQIADSPHDELDSQSLLYHFIEDYIKGVYANLIAIENGHLEFNDQRFENEEGHIETDFSFQLTDFSIDSISARRSEKLFFATNLELQFWNYEMKLADQLHQLNIDSIAVSSHQNQAIIKQLHLHPTSEGNKRDLLRKYKRSELYDISIPMLKLSNTNVHHAFFQKKLNINTFDIIEPQINFKIFANYRRQATNEKLNPEEFYDLLQTYITDVQIHEIHLDNGNLNLTNHSRKGKTITFKNEFSLNLENFRWNEKELHNKRMLFSDNFDLTVKDHLFRLSDGVHLLKAEEIHFSTRNSSGLIENALLYPSINSARYQELSNHFFIRIPRIELKQINIDEIFENEKLQIAEVAVHHPQIELYQNRLAENKFSLKDVSVPLPEELKELQIGKLSLENGELLFYNNRDNEKLNTARSKLNFVLTKASLTRTDETKTARFDAAGIETQIDSLALNPRKGMYRIFADHVNYSSEQNCLQFTGLWIREKNSQPKQIVSIHLPLLKFQQLDPTNAFTNNIFHADQILIQQPEFTLAPPTQKGNFNPFHIQLSKNLKPIMHELSANQIKVEGANFNFREKEGTRRLQNIDILLNQVKLDTLDSKRLLGAKDLTIEKNAIQFSDKNELYQILVDQFRFSSADKQIALKGIHVIPNHGPDDFQQYIDHQQDYYSGDIKQISLEEIDLDKWFLERKLDGKNLRINELNMLIYRDKRLPMDTSKFPPMPQKLLSESKLKFHFDSVLLANSTIVYSERIEETPEPNRITFENLQASLTPFSNNSEEMRADQKYQLKASAKLMGVAALKTNISFDGHSTKDNFSAKGSLKDFDLTALNPITENAASVSIRSGQLNRFEFEFSGDSVRTSGKLRMNYDDLKVSILAHKNGNTKEAKLVSFIANKLVVRSRSPRSKLLIPSPIHYERDRNKSVINYWWKSLFSGIKDHLGIKE